ncbi:hypothetical protein EXIGLDRAFT_744659 [Exidia glandulosa HHB12029]|uniref:Uncharacterized protein n=1 Tax=Exidia glandulosa HHB12029 TaxID=1314781 RepID=A0A165PHG5_EXIGL|nr:hypothetical protein EXIGLDRAFT_744659 [Exidia glandulosa HHB12029]
MLLKPFHLVLLRIVGPTCNAVGYLSPPFQPNATATSLPRKLCYSPPPHINIVVVGIYLSLASLSCLACGGKIVGFWCRIDAAVEFLNPVLSFQEEGFSCSIAEGRRERSQFGRRAEHGRILNHLRFADATHLSVFHEPINGDDVGTLSKHVHRVLHLADGAAQAVHRHAVLLRSNRLRKNSGIRDPPSEIVEQCSIWIGGWSQVASLTIAVLSRHIAQSPRRALSTRNIFPYPRHMLRLLSSSPFITYGRLNGNLLFRWIFGFRVENVFHDVGASSNHAWRVFRLADGVAQTDHSHAVLQRSNLLRKISGIRDPPSESPRTALSTCNGFTYLRHTLLSLSSSPFGIYGRLNSKPRLRKASYRGSRDTYRPYLASGISRFASTVRFRTGAISARNSNRRGCRGRLRLSLPRRPELSTILQDPPDLFARMPHSASGSTSAVFW